MGYGLGIYGNHIIPREDTDFDKGVSRALDGKTSTHNTEFAEKLTTDKLNKLVNKAAMSNQDRQAQAISKADAYSWQVANPQFLRTAANTRLINHQLDTMGIVNPTYPDFDRAYAACDPSLLDIDAAEVARLQDQPLKSFVGTFTKQTFDTLDSMIAEERRAAIQQVTPSSEEDLEFENLPQDQVLTLLKQGVHANQQKGIVRNTVSNCDAWLTLHPDYIDSDRNGKLMLQQLKTNGVLESEASIADYETAYQQLRASGLLSLNQKSLDKQHREELHKRVAQAVAEGGTVFDHTTEDEMETMDLDEVRRRANVVMGRQ